MCPSLLRWWHVACLNLHFSADNFFFNSVFIFFHHFSFCFHFVSFCFHFVSFPFPQCFHFVPPWGLSFLFVFDFKDFEDVTVAFNR